MKFTTILLVILLIISTGVFIYIQYQHDPIVTGKAISSDITNEQKTIDIISITSILTSIISTIGLFINVFLSLRKEKRENENHRLDIKSKELQIEKMNKEINSLKFNKKNI